MLPNDVGTNECWGQLTTLEIACEQCRNAGQVSLGMLWRCRIEKVKECIYVQLIVSDNGRDIVLDTLSGHLHNIGRDWTDARRGCDLWEITSGQASPTRPSDEIVCGVLVNICGLFALCFDDFKYSVYLEPVVRVLWDTLSIDYDFGKICWIDTTTEELGRIVVKILGRVGYQRLVYQCHDLRSESHTIIAWRARTVAAWSKDVAVPDIVVPHSGSLRGGSGELSHSSRERVRGGGRVGTAVLVASL